MGEALASVHSIVILHIASGLSPCLTTYLISPDSTAAAQIVTWQRPSTKSGEWSEGRRLTGSGFGDLFTRIVNTEKSGVRSSSGSAKLTAMQASGAVTCYMILEALAAPWSPLLVNVTTTRLDAYRSNFPQVKALSKSAMLH